MSEVKTTITTITPKRAANMLLKNPKNRSIKPGLVKSIARDLAAGHWQFNGDAIRLDEDGNLIDGQHRLFGCVESGVPFKTILLCGLPNEVRKTIDSGTKRTVGERFQMEGILNAPATAAAINVLFRLANQNERVRATASEADQILSLHPRLETSVTHTLKSFAGVNSALAALHYIGISIDREEDANDFVGVWRTGIPSYHGDAAHVCRERLLRMRGTNHILSGLVMARLVCHSFNLFLRASPIRKIAPPDYYRVPGWDVDALFRPASDNEKAGQ